MKRVSVTLTAELAARLERHLAAQRHPPTVSRLVEVALTEHLDRLDRRAWLERRHRPAPDPGPLDLPVSDADVEPDVNANHDVYVGRPRRT